MTVPVATPSELEGPLNSTCMCPATPGTMAERKRGRCGITDGDGARHLATEGEEEQRPAPRTLMRVRAWSARVESRMTA